MNNQKEQVLEIEDVKVVNQLSMSNDFCQPRFSEKRNCYILIRRKNADKP